mmetsp:Transcript_619/g.1668  ORF Transcript_619/g.1668 Transcript_619/m.1668 type:complete len:90 (-) Transcript_619:455-724(-)
MAFCISQHVHAITGGITHLKGPQFKHIIVPCVMYQLAVKRLTSEPDGRLYQGTWSDAEQEGVAAQMNALFQTIVLRVDMLVKLAQRAGY